MLPRHILPRGKMWLRFLPSFLLRREASQAAHSQLTCVHLPPLLYVFLSFYTLPTQHLLITSVPFRYMSSEVFSNHQSLTPEIYISKCRIYKWSVMIIITTNIIAIYGISYFYRNMFQRRGRSGAADFESHIIWAKGVHPQVVYYSHFRLLLQGSSVSHWA